MQSDKEIKKEFRLKASKQPEKYYAVSVLKKEGFSRKKCPKCSTHFWAIDQDVCGDPACSGGFRFINKKVTSKKYSYIELWKEFSSMFKKKGYTPIKRYPVAARWRADTDFVQASIYDFQPYVVSGEVEPPANPLVVPQLCLRFNDIDNVGLTGAHYTCFIMIGQHAFMPPEKWDQAKYFSDIHDWLRKGLGLKNETITYHEDAWAGGGNFGPSMEFFSHGLELGNQVYMQYQKTPSGPKELNLKVLDMGMGYERNVWFTNGSSTSYESAFPTVCKKLYEKTGIKPNKNLIKNFLPYSSYLNIDEVDNIDKAWKKVAGAIKVDVKDLKKEILPLAALYSVAEHSRTLLVALSDSALPSNVGGGYNLRTIFRRAQSFIHQHGWKISIPEICSWHADYLKPLFPELSEYLEEVEKILKVEKVKYKNTQQKISSIVASLSKVDEKKLFELYDSQGIAPELIKEEFEKQDKEIRIPENFYARVSELHEKTAREHQTKHDEDEIDLSDISETQALYYDDWSTSKFKSKVAKIEDNKIILEQTLFYPTSGGQLHDIGKIDGIEITNVYKQGPHIIHVLSQKPNFKVGQLVSGEIDLERRKQLAQHHTSTHIINAAARIVLGRHTNQAGAKKTVEKAHIDLTHYQSLTSEELQEIERQSNLIIQKRIPVKKSFMPRTEAEQKYGFTIYQGGVPPGKKLRIVEIPGYDVEACGGTHLNNTSEAQIIKILKSSKIQDGIVRIEFVAGNAALLELGKETKILNEAASLLKCEKYQVPARCSELFEKWKLSKKGKIDKFTLESTEREKLTDKELLERASLILKTQPEHVANTIKKFLKDLAQ
ncbi:MAG: alanine--tRNA ligase [Nanoarchaeota archaeon]